MVSFFGNEMPLCGLGFRSHLRTLLKRRQTHQSNVKLKYHYDLLIGKSPYKHVNEVMDLQMLKSVDEIVPKGPVELEERSSFSRSSSLSSIRSTANNENRSLSAVSFTSPENPLSMIDWTSDEVALDNSTPASSVYSDLSLLIDPRLLNESDPQPIILSL